MTNIEKYKSDLKKLIKFGGDLIYSLQYECYPENFIDACKKSKSFTTKKALDEYINQLPNFNENYQKWYSEAKSVIKLFLPDRLDDFIKYYEIPKNRKDMQAIDATNYVICDALNNLELIRGYEKKFIAGKSTAITKLQQQLYILKSVQSHFESSLFNLNQILQGDLFDSEIDAAEHLNKNGFVRASGALAGVVLESHLLQVCRNHNLTLGKNPSISNYNDLLKNNGIIDTPTFRRIQLCGDLRNKCDHKKTTDPTKDEIFELIENVKKIIKEIY